MNKTKIKEVSNTNQNFTKCNKENNLNKGIISSQVNCKNVSLSIDLDALCCAVSLEEFSNNFNASIDFNMKRDNLSYKCNKIFGRFDLKTEKKLHKLKNYPM